MHVISVTEYDKNVKKIFLRKIYTEKKVLSSAVLDAPGQFCDCQYRCLFVEILE